MEKYVRTNKSRIGILNKDNQYVFMQGKLPLAKGEWWEDDQYYTNDKLDLIKMGDIIKFKNSVIGDGFGQVIAISKKTNSVKIKGDYIVAIEDIIGLFSEADANDILEVI